METLISPRSLFPLLKKPTSKSSSSFSRPVSSQSPKLTKPESPAPINLLTDAKQACAVGRRRSMMMGGFLMSGLMLSEANLPTSAFALTPVFREYIDTFDGYSFKYPQNWIQVRGAGADIFFRDPIVLDENLSVEFSSPSSSKYKSLEDLGSPEEAGKRVLRQYLTEFMSTRLGVKRESNILTTSSRVADDGNLYYQVEVNIKSYANNNELAVMPQDRVARLEWDRRYLAVHFDLGLSIRARFFFWPLVCQDMDNEEVLDFDVDDDGIDIEPNDMLDDTTNSDAATYFPDGDLEPYEGLEFESEESAKAFYNSYARRIGFSTRVSSSRRSRRDGAIIQRQFVCAKEGFRNMNEKRTKDREIKRPRTITRVGCKASLSVKMHDSSGKWAVSGFVKEHNHELVPPDQVHCLRSHRQISGPAKALIDTLQAAGMGPRRIMSALIKEYGGISKVGFTEVDCRNYMRNNRQKSIQGEIQLLLDYLSQMNAHNPTFFYSLQGSSEDVGNVFWADPKAITDFTYFGDTVTFDTTYRSNRYRLPFAPFTGVNHHGQPILFGCAFIVNENEASFVWLFKTWLAAMSGHSPVSITTDHDAVIRAAVMQVFPEARHRFCKWHIFKKCQEKLSHVFLRHPSFESDLHKTVNLTDSVEDFESCWFSLLDKYELRDHDWLQALYSDRRQWVPVYLRDTFFAEMSSTQRSDSINSYFDGYINASTNLSQFFKLYEKALESRLEKEVKADYDTMNSPPVLKTPSPMEKQASELYTRKLFTRFQEELVGTLTFMASKADDDGDLGTYQVAKYGETHKAHCVKFNILEMRANCSCQMFEFSGIVCRHILAVFRVTNLLTLPPYYILKRWTRNAKSSVIFDDYGLHAYDNYLESHTVRYNTLRHKAFSFVQEAGKSLYTCDVALVALQEAAKTVSLEMKNEVRRTMANGHVKGSSASGGEQVLRNEDSQQDEPEDEMDKKIIELRNELELANRRCEAYRTNLLSVLKEMEDQKLQVSIKVQNIKISLKDSL